MCLLSKLKGPGEERQVDIVVVDDESCVPHGVLSFHSSTLHWLEDVTELTGMDSAVHECYHRSRCSTLKCLHPRQENKLLCISPQGSIRLESWCRIAVAWRSNR